MSSKRPQSQWRRQRSKGARSFRGQNILEPGHPDAHFFLKKVDDLFLVVALTTQRPPTPLRLFHCQNKTNNSKDSDMVIFFVFWAMAVDLPSRSFDPARPGVAPPLYRTDGRLDCQSPPVTVTNHSAIHYGDRERVYWLPSSTRRWRHWVRSRTNAIVKALSYICRRPICSPVRCVLIRLNWRDRVDRLPTVVEPLFSVHCRRSESGSSLVWFSDQLLYHLTFIIIMMMTTTTATVIIK